MVHLATNKSCFILQIALSNLLNEADDGLASKQHQILQYNADHVQNNMKIMRPHAAGKKLVPAGDEKQVISL